MEEGEVEVLVLVVMVVRMVEAELDKEDMF